MQVKIACQGHTEIEIDALREFQGKLKSLAEADYQKLKGDIIDMGFSFPVSVWKNADQNYLLDGHQRLKTLKRMREEGFEIPSIPASVVEAKSYKEAKRKLLGAASQFGKVESSGLLEFMTEAELEIDDVVENFKMPEIDLEMFSIEHFKDFTLEAGAHNTTKIEKYDAEKDGFSVRIEGVVLSHKEKVLKLVNDALKTAGFEYTAGAF